MRRVAGFLTALVCMLAATASAHASPRDVIRDCTDNGRIDGFHSQSDYNGALRRLPSDVDEYTDCRQIIEEARRRDANRPPPGGGGGGGIAGGFDSSSGGFPPGPPGVPATPGERNALSQAITAGGQPVQLAGEPITPGGAGITEAAVRHALPGPLLALLVLLGLGAVMTILSGARARGLRAPAAVLRVFDRVFPHRA
jgi:hypothetical protein